MARYYKLHQRVQLWHYIELLEDRTPVAAQVLNFLNSQPQLYFQEFDLSDPGSRIEYQALTRSAIAIEQSEYEQAYGLATKGDFDVYTDSKKQ